MRSVLSDTMIINMAAHLKFKIAGGQIGGTAVLSGFLIPYLTNLRMKRIR